MDSKAGCRTGSCDSTRTNCSTGIPDYDNTRTAIASDTVGTATTTATT